MRLPNSISERILSTDLPGRVSRQARPIIFSQSHFTASCWPAAGGETVRTQ